MNVVFLIGRVGKPATVKQVGADSQWLATVSIATSKWYVDKRTGITQQQTEWHKIVCFAKQEKGRINYIRGFNPGDLISIVGTLKHRSSVNKQTGVKYYDHYVDVSAFADRVEIVSRNKSKPSAEETAHPGDPRPLGPEGEEVATDQDAGDYPFGDVGEGEVF